MLLQNDPLFNDSLFNDSLFNDSLFNAVFNRLGSPASSSTMVAPMDAYRRGSDVWVQLDLPGIAADSLDISIERNVLTVTGERSTGRRDGDQVYMSDRAQGRFRRQVHLGDALDTESIEADYSDGVLSLRIPVAETAKPRKIPVKAASPVIDAQSSPAVSPGSESSESESAAARS